MVGETVAVCTATLAGVILGGILLITTFAVVGVITLYNEGE